MESSKNYINDKLYDILTTMKIMLHKDQCKNKRENSQGNY